MLKEKMTKYRPRLHPLPAGLSMGRPHTLLATWFGVGRLRPAPGTLGTLAGIPPGFALQYFGGIQALLIGALILAVAGAFAATRYGRATGEPDDQSIVVDEVAGLWIAALPAQTDWRLWALAFVMFRFFDVVKAWPASYYDRKKRGGYDVIMDDLVAGVYAMLAVAGAAVPLLVSGAIP